MRQIYDSEIRIIVKRKKWVKIDEKMKTTGIWNWGYKGKGQRGIKD